MTFTDKQGIKLREKIETALSPFPEDKLKNIFLEYKGIFGANFYNEISGSNDRSKIITLIVKLKNQQKFKDFIDIVSKEYPIIQERYQIYSQLSPLIFLLKDIFQECRNFSNFSGDFENIDRLEDHLLELTEKNDQNSLLSDTESFSFNYYLDFIDFVERYFVKILTARDIKDHLQQKLRKWIEINCSDIKIPDKQDILFDLQSYLLITIFPMGGQTKNYKKTFNVQGELIENWDDTKNENWDDTNIKVELNEEDFEENGYLEKQIPNIIYKFIKKVEYVYLRDQLLQQDKIYDLKLELFLTTELFIKDFEFKIPDALKPKQKAICEAYPVILRSLERLQPDKTSWLKCYAENLRRMKKKPVISNNIQDFKQENELNKLLSKAQQRKLLGIQLENKIILKISCGLPKGTKTFHLFEIILEKGVPLCLWIKSKNQRDSLNDYHYKSIIKELNNLIEVKKILDLNRLHAKIFEIRKKHLAMADSCKKEYLGYHLRILCDCNDRKPINIPAFNQLITNS